MKQLKTTFILIFVITLLLTACAPGEIALQVTGNVASEKGWTENQVKKMDTVESDYMNKDGETSTYTGVLITNLLDEAKVNDGATAVVFVGDDGYTAELTLEELQSCPDCIVSFQDEGGFRIVMPDFSSKLQVKGIIEIQVK
jgi:DMSO/TMAO reductase YedYZ molybdopterin-dependent catalytic subunit